MVDCQVCYDGQFCTCQITYRMNPSIGVSPCGNCKGFVSCPSCGLEINQPDQESRDEDHAKA